MAKSTLSIEVSDFRAIVRIGETNLDRNVAKILEILNGMTVTEIHSDGVSGLKDGMKIDVFAIECEDDIPWHIHITYQKDDGKKDHEKIYLPFPIWRAVCGIINKIRDEVVKQTLKTLKDVEVETKEE